MTFASAGVLAGAYHGKDISQRNLLSHAVSTVDIKIGKLSRKADEALCNKKIDLVDSFGYGDISEVDCPRCNEILDRIGIR